MEEDEGWRAAMMAPLDPALLRALARALDVPGEGYHDAIAALVDALAPVRLDAARMVTGFLDRVADLAPLELQELFSQTFDRLSVAAERPAELLRRLSYVDAEVQPEFVARVAAPAFDRLLAVLEPERNPFALLVKAAYCLVLPAVADRTAADR
jgi:nitrate reductase assembly molybdenum cofactor insertion protein NarJ